MLVFTPMKQVFQKNCDNLFRFYINLTYPHTEGQQAEIWPNGKSLNSCQGAIINFLTTENIQKYLQKSAYISVEKQENRKILHNLAFSSKNCE